MVNVGMFFDHSEYFTAIWYNLWPFGICLVIWFNYSVLVRSDREKSGNPGRICSVEILMFCRVVVNWAEFSKSIFENRMKGIFAFRTAFKKTLLSQPASQTLSRESERVEPKRKQKQKFLNSELQKVNRLPLTLIFESFLRNVEFGCWRIKLRVFSFYLFPTMLSMVQCPVLKKTRVEA
jgi:hypothetical protein